jgi:hypothetical protein
VLAISPFFIHKDPDYWESPEEFMPERFIRPANTYGVFCCFYFYFYFCLIFNFRFFDFVFVNVKIVRVGVVKISIILHLFHLATGKDNALVLPFF